MGLVQRRIGLLFAVFLGLLAIAALRAAWLGTVRGDTLKRAAVTQQDVKVAVPARRGLITDRRGVELAVTEPAQDVSATPYIVKEPVKVAAKIAKLLGKSEAEVIKQLSRRDTGFV